MFEAVIALCLSLASGPCRDHLVPGYEAQTVAACEARLAAEVPDLAGFTEFEAKGNAQCQSVGESLLVTEVAPGVFVHRGAIAEPDATNRGDVVNLGFVIGNAGVAVIDTGTARWMGEALWRAIRARTDLPVTHVVLTHMHPDHVFGAGPFVEAGAQVVGHARLSRALADRQVNYLDSLDRLVGVVAMLSTKSVAVDIAIENTAEIDLGDRLLSLRSWPAAHTGTDLTVLDFISGTLFAGDLIFDEHTPALDGRLMGWLAVLSELEAMELARVVPGHGGPSLEWPEGAAATRQYLEILEVDTRAALDAGQRLGDAVEGIANSEAGNWAMFEAYNPRNATVAFTELEWE